MGRVREEAIPRLEESWWSKWGYSGRLGSRHWLCLGMAYQCHKGMAIKGYQEDLAPDEETCKTRLLVQVPWMCLWIEFQWSPNPEALDGDDLQLRFVAGFAEEMPRTSWTCRVQRQGSSGFSVLSRGDGQCSGEGSHQHLALRWRPRWSQLSSWCGTVPVRDRAGHVSRWNLKGSSGGTTPNPGTFQEQISRRATQGQAAWQHSPDDVEDPSSFRSLIVWQLEETSSDERSARLGGGVSFKDGMPRLHRIPIAKAEASSINRRDACPDGADWDGCLWVWDRFVWGWTTCQDEVSSLERPGQRFCDGPFAAEVRGQLGAKDKWHYTVFLKMAHGSTCLPSGLSPTPLPASPLRNGWISLEGAALVPQRSQQKLIGCLELRKDASISWSQRWGGSRRNVQNLIRRYAWIWRSMVTTRLLDQVASVLSSGREEQEWQMTFRCLPRFFQESLSEDWPKWERWPILHINENGQNPVCQSSTMLLVDRQQSIPLEIWWCCGDNNPNLGRQGEGGQAQWGCCFRRARLCG